MKIIITAGGTGGHIYPALAIINKFKEHDPKTEVIYVGTTNRMEKDIIPQYNIKYVPIEIYGLTKNIIKDLKRYIDKDHRNETSNKAKSMVKMIVNRVQQFS